MSQRPARRTRSGARHLALALAHWAGGHTVSNEELLRRIVKARAEAHQEVLEEHRRLVGKAFKKATKLARIAEEDGGLTPAAKAELKAAKVEAERHSAALRALGEFEVPDLDPGQVRHRRRRIAAARCAVLAAPAAGIAALSVTTTWWAAPAAAALGMVGAWARGPKPYDLTVRPVPADLIAETPMVIPPAPHTAVPAGTAPVAGLVVPPVPATAPGTAGAAPAAQGGAPAEGTEQHLVLALSKALSACRVIPRGMQVTLLAAPEVTAERWTVVVRLPDDNGATVDDVVAARKNLGGELGLDRARLHVEQVAGADDKTLRVSGFTTDPFAEPVLCTPDMLADVDVWEQGIPVSFDAFGRILFLRLKDVSILLGGSSRSGKGAALRLIIAGCLLDARVRLHLADGKHPGQNRWRGLTESYIWDPDKRAKQLAKRLEALVAEMGVRAVRLAELGVESLAERPDLVGTEGLTLEVVVIDEVSAFTLDAKHGKKITQHLIALSARGLAFGIVLVLATQLSTAGVLDRLITGNIVWRWCMYATDADGSNSILGKGMAGRGYSAHLLDPEQRGVGLLRREGRVTTVRSLWLDGDDMTAVQDMVRALRAPAAQPSAPIPAQAPPAPVAPVPGAALEVDWSVLEGWLNTAAPAPGPSAPADTDPKAKALELIRQAGPEGIKRAEVADALGASPNTVGGWLKGWTEQGLIEALGAPPHTRYAATDGRQ
ncbi:helix-turn-helix domain-containing protein [Streptomyces goshikiensis]|uniref:helix-turn-helix domain-containing protein n=1 Tax=Streptomyces goshikiensis TaxID=1942 RepID=UPI003712B412